MHKLVCIHKKRESKHLNKLTGRVERDETPGSMGYIGKWLWEDGARYIKTAPNHTFRLVAMIRKQNEAYSLGIDSRKQYHMQRRT